ncbi:MAG: PorV/PorQ family protein [Elusimicrobiota bacterium]
MKKIIAIIIFTIVCIGISFAGFSKNDAGTRGLQFLKIGVGVRAVGMGGAYAGLSDDVNAIYWNPAGLNKIERNEVSLMHCIWFEDIRYQSLVFAHPTSDASYGLMVNYLGMDPIGKVTNTGQSLGDKYSPSDIAVTLSYARVMFGAPVGVNLKYISSNIDTERAVGIAGDVGMQFELAEDVVSLGIAVQNIGQDLVYIKEGTSLPLNIKTGLAYKTPVGMGELIITGDVNAPIDNKIGFNLGAEYKIKINEKFSISPRAGYRTDHSELEGTKDISLGWGILFNDIELDYAWTPYGELGMAHQMSLLLRFD